MPIAKINNIPVYEALIGDEDCGMFRISLVDSPAVMSDFVAFDEQKQVVLYAIEDEDERKVLGVVMRADFPIYRYDKERGEFYIIYKADTIAQMAEKYLLESRQNDVNLDHDDDKVVDGVQMLQFFIKDSAKGINPAGFDEIADGSLFAEFHVVNDDVWDEIKNGTYKGFSLEGVFELEPEQDEKGIEGIVERLDGKFAKLSKSTIMSKFKKFMEALEVAFAEEQKFNSTTTDKGVISWDGEDDIKVGDAVYVDDADGNKIAAADQDYKLEDGTIVRIVEGKVSEIIAPETEETPENAEAEEVKSGKVATDNGELVWDGEEDLKAGDEVFIVDEEGNRAPAADGDYKTEDGKTIKVADGKVTEIVDPEAEVSEEDMRKQNFERVVVAHEQSYTDKMNAIAEALKTAGYYGWLADAGDEFAVLEYWDELTSSYKYEKFAISFDESGNVTIGAHEEVKPGFIPVSEIAEESSEEEALMSMITRITEENKALKEENIALKKQPQAKPAHQEFKQSAKLNMAGLPKGKQNLAKIVGK